MRDHYCEGIGFIIPDVAQAMVITDLMKNKRRSISHGAFTMVELCVITLIIVVLMALVLPMLQHERPANRIRCVNNLKNVGLSSRIFSTDHNDKFPQAISTNKGGTMELDSPQFVWKHFQVLSNELSTPKVLICHSDFIRPRGSIVHQPGQYEYQLFCITGC